MCSCRYSFLQTVTRDNRNKKVIIILLRSAKLHSCHTAISFHENKIIDLIVGKYKKASAWFVYYSFGVFASERHYLVEFDEEMT